MGMFDYLRCEVPLPDGWTGDLQTKDFDCDQTTHVITADGRLLLDRGGAVEVPLAERTYPDESNPSCIIGSMRWVPKLEDANYDGIVHFGGLEVESYRDGDRYRPIYKHHDYVAKFTDGQLVGIELDEDA